MLNSKEVNTQNESLTYDHNGNTVTLLRNQRNYTGTGYTSQAIDNLTYTMPAATNYRK